MLRQGIMNKSGKDITLSKITDVSYYRRMLDRMVASGTLSIESAGNSPNELFRAIPHSDRVQQLINRLIDEDANKRLFRGTAVGGDFARDTTRLIDTSGRPRRASSDERSSGGRWGG